MQFIEQIEVIDLGDKGRAIGRAADGRIVLVEQAVPGDIIDGHVVQRKKGMKIVRPTRFHQRSEMRVEPTCQHFGVCGGCKWQNLDYASQIQYKEKAVRDALIRIANIPAPIVEPIIGCEEEYYYRNKLEFTFTDQRWLTGEEINSNSQLERTGLGFHKPGSFARVLDIDHCHLQPEPSNRIRNRVRELCRQLGYSFQNIRSRSGALRNLLVRNNRHGEVLVLLVFGKDLPEDYEILLEQLQIEFPEIVSLYYCVNYKMNDSLFGLKLHLYCGDKALQMTLGEVKFNLGPVSFFQTNTRQAKVLYDLVVEMAEVGLNDLIFDLYCGIGSIGLYLAKRARQVVGVEEVPAAIGDARRNAIENGIDNVEFHIGDARRVVESPEFQAYGIPDVVITDPPRAGMHTDVIAHLNQLRAKRLVYVSCNPSTQARDIAVLGEVYRFVRCRPVDMFPHTSHIENVALLEVM